MVTTQNLMPEHTLILAFSTWPILTQNCTVLSVSVITHYDFANVLQANRKLLLHCNSMQSSNIVSKFTL